MGFDDIFEHDHKRHKQGYDHNHNHKDHDDHSIHSYDHQNDIKLQFLSKLQKDPKFKLLLIAISIIATIILITMVILLFPLITKLFHFIGENGLQGLIDAIWKGSK